MLEKFKSALLSDNRAIKAVTQIRELYETADNPQAFHDALEAGEMSKAAAEVDLTEEELCELFNELRGTGTELASEYADLAKYDKDEFIEA
jgi:hypothetical protein